MSARSSCTSTEPARFLPRRIVLSIMIAVLLVHVGWAIAQQPDPFTPPQTQPAEGQQPIDIADLLGSESRAANDALEAGQSRGEIRRSRYSRYRHDAYNL